MSLNFFDRDSILTFMNEQYILHAIAISINVSSKDET
jgi:hypothetical protein